MNKQKPMELSTILLILLIAIAAVGVFKSYNNWTNPMEAGIVELHNYPIGFLCYDKMLTTEDYLERNEEEAVEELVRVVGFVCAYAAYERPWWQRFFGIAGHNHFIGLDENKAWQLMWVQDGFGISYLTKKKKDGFEDREEELQAHIDACDLDFNVIY